MHDRLRRIQGGVLRKLLQLGACNCTLRSTAGNLTQRSFGPSARPEPSGTVAPGVSIMTNAIEVLGLRKSFGRTRALNSDIDLLVDFDQGSSLFDL
jgi:hypothetical protein